MYIVNIQYFSNIFSFSVRIYYSDGTRFGGIVDAMFAVDTYVHLVWASDATNQHYLYKNGVNAATRLAPPRGVDLHDDHRIGGVGRGGEFKVSSVSSRVLQDAGSPALPVSGRHR